MASHPSLSCLTTGSPRPGNDRRKLLGRPNKLSKAAFDRQTPSSISAKAGAISLRDQPALFRLRGKPCRGSFTRPSVDLGELVETFDLLQAAALPRLVRLHHGADATVNVQVSARIA